MGASASNKAAIRQYKHDLAIREGNWNKDQSVYRSRMVDYKNEYDENHSAAGRAYAAEQTRMNEMFDQVAFQKQDMLTQLLQSQGQLGTSEKYGKSAARMNTATLGAFGRNNAIIAANLASARNAMQQRNEDTRLQLQGANNRAWGQVAIGPTATVAPLAPTMQKPDYLGLALGIGSAVGGGLMKGNANKAPEGWGAGNKAMASNFRTDLNFGNNFNTPSNIGFPSLKTPTFNTSGFGNGFNLNAKQYW